MKISHSLKMFAGSVAVYVAVAAAYACGDANQPAKPGRVTSTAASSGGEGGASGASGAGGVAGSTSESVGAGPVPPAMADPVPGARLQSVYRVAEDGSRQWYGWHDSELDAACFWRPMSDGKDHCVPGYVPYLGYFADAECSQLVFRPLCDNNNSRRGLVPRTVDQCSVIFRVFELQPLRIGTQLYGSTATGCIEVSGQTSLDGDAIGGTEVPPSEFVASDIVREP